MSKVVDYYGPHGAEFMACLRDNGVAGIARYLTNSTRDPRQITPQEVAAAHAAGLEVHFFYEMNPTYRAYFTFAQGAEDCRQAVDRLRELGAPEGTVVYFVVDAPTSVIPVAVLDNYFAGVMSMVTPQIRPGIYGFEAHVEHARATFTNVGQHLAQTYGTPRGPLDLWQHEQLAMCGVSVDIDDVTVSGWGPKEANVTTPQRIGQSAACVEIAPGEHSILQAIYEYEPEPSGETRARTIVRKVTGSKPGAHFFEIRPPVDPDDDESIDLDAEPAKFLVVVLPTGAPPPPAPPAPGAAGGGTAGGGGDTTLVMTVERGFVPRWIAIRDKLTIQ